MLSIIGFVIFTILAFVFIGIVIKVFSAERHVYNTCYSLNTGFLDSLKGTMPTFREGSRDYKLMAGLAYDAKNKKFVEQGAISENLVDEILQ